MNRFLIDGFNLAYRAAYANKDLTGPGGIPSGVIYGFFRTLIPLKKRFPSEKFEIAWDSDGGWRKEANPQYKANRVRSESISDQLEDLKALSGLFGIKQHQYPGEEADDVIAYLCGIYRDEGICYIYSNDKDFLQLVEDGRVHVIRPKIGTNPERVFDEAAVVELFGVPPKSLPAFRAFDGDTSDNLAGVPRLPRKVIASLVNKYGSVEAIYNGIDKENLTIFQKNGILQHKISVISNEKIMRLTGNLAGLASESVRAESEPETGPRVDESSKILRKYGISSKSLDPQDIISLFSRVADVRYSDPKSTVIETFNIFED